MSSEKPAPSGPEDRMEKIVALAKRRGFIYPSSEIYGGINGFWDYGPLGVELKRNVKDAWWQDLVRCPPVGPDGQPIRMVGLDSAIIMNPKVWEASGHLAGFSDPMVDCKQCKARFRADKVFIFEIKIAESETLPGTFPVWAVEADSYKEACGYLVEAVKRYAKHNNLVEFKKEIGIQETVPRSEMLQLVGARDCSLYFGHFRGDSSMFNHYLDLVTCPKCETKGTLTEPRQFNLMFESYAGALRDDASKVYLRPETAQGIFANYKNVLDTTRLKIPFGIAQIGKAFRNEINPRNSTFRSREFEQMEIEFFCHPNEADRWYEYWRNERYQWYVRHGLRSDKLHLRDHDKGELAHYARACADVEYAFPFGTSELEGVANRTDFDLTTHAKHSGKDLSYYDQTANERYTPYVIEPAAGLSRSLMTFLVDAYEEDEAPNTKGGVDTRTVLRLDPRLAPTKVAVLPLSRNADLSPKARALATELRLSWNVDFDDSGAIGKRYRRQDEVGTPYCVTVDFDTLEDDAVTVRERDSMKQERVGLDQVRSYFAERLIGC